MHSKYDFDSAFAESDRIAYVRPVAVATLPAEVQSQVGGLTTIYAVHDADGAQLALVRDRALAFALVRQHDRVPVNVH